MKTYKATTLQGLKRSFALCSKWIAVRYSVLFFSRVLNKIGFVSLIFTDTCHELAHIKEIDMNTSLHAEQTRTCIQRNTILA